MLRLSASAFRRSCEPSNANVDGRAEQAQLRFSLRAGFAADAALAMRTCFRVLVRREYPTPAVLVKEGLVK